MRILVASFLVLAGSLAQAETLVDKMYAMHFESVKETLAAMYGVNPEQITKETKFSNKSPKGVAIELGALVYGVVAISNTYYGKSYPLENVMNEFMQIEAREGCNPSQKDKNGFFVLDAECISRVLWYSKQRRA